jgi:hypothetical protein
MSNFSRLAVFLYAVVLFISISGGNYGKLLPVNYQGLEGENSSSYFSENKLNAFCLFGTGESLVKTVHSFPNPDSKQFPNYFHSRSFSNEERIQNVVSEYLLHSKEINRSLTIRDIIFPFHYFW